MEQKISLTANRISLMSRQELLLLECRLRNSDNIEADHYHDLVVKRLRHIAAQSAKKRSGFFAWLKGLFVK